MTGLLETALNAALQEITKKARRTTTRRTRRKSTASTVTDAIEELLTGKKKRKTRRTPARARKQVSRKASVRSRSKAKRAR